MSAALLSFSAMYALVQQRDDDFPPSITSFPAYRGHHSVRRLPTVDGVRRSDPFGGSPRWKARPPVEHQSVKCYSRNMGANRRQIIGSRAPPLRDTKRTGTIRASGKEEV